MGKNENKNLEFKQELSKSYLKTVSAFANYGDGEIRFGVDDNGNIVGINDPKDIAMRIENQINDNIKPVPVFSINVDNKNGIVSLLVNLGEHKPYMYNGKAYKRSDTSTVEVDRYELNRLILEGNHQDFEALPSRIQNPEFKYLERKLIEKLNITELNIDILKTLSLYNDKTGYNIAAELLADKNSFIGIEYIQFGSDINIISNHDDFSGLSLIEQFDRMMRVFEQFYKYEIITDKQRNVVELIPAVAFREAIANAVVHRIWDVKTSIKISFYTDHIDIISPGALPSGVSEKEYLKGQLSILRNPIFGNVFFRLGYIEKFGTGIRRIINSYENNYHKPEFIFNENSIVVRLPKLFTNTSNLSNDERKLLMTMSNNLSFRRRELEEELGFNKDKIIRLLNRLIELGLIDRFGSGPQAKYSKRK